ncbi:hypothetical protein VTN96DRAFT_1310 [Rasamsonia emersonii]|uniref:Eukaryotic translation initiation factor 2c n=1 Tax=Rasamsonia emersonii (strain ATCC 16479 / CBS 393.64 / IMI 116815) TaxID=1408163 RepID=A0A0F4YPV7_RASE3|nr:Eukaryotic translation initiation factor 2c [Rasamsonia emersonii CBS 393.64]KKA20284.1 Eukaryotic translation initiation factor 2c [Rasamsonia emersonii CBS 393.64]
MSNPSKDQPSKADEKPIPSDPFLVHPKEGKRLGARNQYADPAWRMKYLVPVNTVPRPGFNTTGREVELKLNAYPITQFPTRSVWQYDITIGNNEKRAVVKKVWNSSVRKQNLRQMIFDGNKLAWSFHKYEDFSAVVDLDQEEGRAPTGIKPNKFRLFCHRTKQVNLAVIDAWLSGRQTFDESILEALNFLDHLMREYPSTKYSCFKRSFYNEKIESEDLHDGVICYKGYYQAIRAALPGRLVVNVDVENTAFWARITLAGQARAFVNARDYWEVGRRTQPKDDGYFGHMGTTEWNLIYDRIRKLEVQPFYKGCPVNRTFFVKGLVLADTNQFTIDYKDKATGKTEKLTMFQYFKKRYNVILEYPNLPVVEMTKNGVFYPMEHLVIVGLQRYPYKLNDEQTYRMLKFAVQRPQARLASVQESKKALDHANDPVLKSFGLKVGDEMIKTKARVLPNPEIQFANQKHNPGVTGRWDLRGKKFLKTNRVPLKSWGCGIIVYKRNTLEMTQAENWIDGFMKQYAGHGGKIENRPVIMLLKDDIADAIEKLYEKVGNHFRKTPQLLIFFAPNKDSWPYLRIKKSCDCRWGVPSQVLQSQQVVKMNTQYMSNVAMKINAKLGGVTARSVPRVTDASLRPGSIIIGADVSHATPGSWAPSMSAIAVSADEYGAKYMGNCETGYRHVEIIEEQNMKEMLIPMIDEWTATVGKGRRPQYVYYFRDGVSTGQFSHVLEHEVPVIKQVIMHNSTEKVPPKICVVIANKRHHLRAFPRPDDKNAADRNGNPVPGTLIERDITSPHDWDFLLYPHIALQGTARPVHYHVILDQIGHKPHQLQNMIYDHSYQYVRSTTSVSLFPAVYYAHLISNRARHHENVPSKSGPQSGPYIKLTDLKEKKPQYPGAEPKRLLPMVQNETRNHLEMWFV